MKIVKHIRQKGTLESFTTTARERSFTFQNGKIM